MRRQHDAKTARRAVVEENGGDADKEGAFIEGARLLDGEPGRAAGDQARGGRSVRAVLRRGNQRN